MLLIGTKTKYGKVSGITCKEGERYYFLIDKYGTVSLLPADLLETNV
jgi:hypothetical protein